VAAATATAVSGVVVYWLTGQVASLRLDSVASTANALFIVGMTLLAVTGCLVVRAGHHPVMGWLLVGTGLVNVLGRLAMGLAAAAHESTPSVAPTLGWLTNWCWIPGLALAMLLILRFPDGVLLGRWRRVVQQVVLAWTAVAVFVTAFAPGPLGAEELEPLTNPFGIGLLSGILDAALGVLFTLMPVLLLVVIVAAMLRWRHATDRRELRPVALALAFLAVATPLALARGEGRIVEGLAWLVLPVAVAYAVARHDLWDVDLRRRFDRLRGVREEERNRLRRDLHDSLGPLLGSISLRAEAARNLLAADAPRAQVDEVLLGIGTQAEVAAVEVRRVIDELGPSALAESDLVTALAALLEGHASSGTEFVLEAPAALPTLSPAAEVALYRVASEAVRNAVRHAQAGSCTVSLAVLDGQVELSVTDDGVGLRGRPAGVGRTAMADRIAAVGGAFALRDGVDGGVQLTARVAGVGSA
jgi:signal transduction histidine kinase